MYFLKEYFYVPHSKLDREVSQLLKYLYLLRIILYKNGITKMQNKCRHSFGSSIHCNYWSLLDHFYKYKCRWININYIPTKIFEPP